MDPEYVKYFATLGVGGILAIIFYYQGRKDYDNFSAQIKALLEAEKGRTELLVKVIVDNTSAIVKNTAVVESYHDRLDTERRVVK